MPGGKLLLGSHLSGLKNHFSRNSVTMPPRPLIHDKPLLTERLPYGVLSTVALLLLVATVGLVGFWPINADLLVEGYLSTVPGPIGGQDPMTPNPDGKALNQPLIGLFYVTPEEATELLPGTSIQITVEGFLESDVKPLVGTVLASSAETLQAESPPTASPRQSPPLAKMVYIPPPPLLAECDRGRWREGLRIHGRVERRGNPRRLIEATGLVKIFGWRGGSIL
jgi:hypothetical protein